MLERRYMLVRSTHNYHLYEWVGAPEGSKGFVKQLYISKDELGNDPPSEFVMRISAAE